MSEINEAPQVSLKEYCKQLESAVAKQTVIANSLQAYAEQLREFNESAGNRIDALESEIRKRDERIRSLEESLKETDAYYAQGRTLHLNKVKCPACGDYIVSMYTHDFRTCSCGKTSVDGGFEYLRRGYDGDVGYIECSEYLMGKSEA